MENNGSTVARQTEEDIGQSPRRDNGVSNGGNELGKQFETDINDNGQDVRSRIQGLNVVQNTVPDTFRSAPKFISPTVHGWLDAAVTAYFLGVGAWYAMRGKRRPATAAFVNAGMVAGVSMLTDYHGTGRSRSASSFMARWMRFKPRPRVWRRYCTASLESRLPLCFTDRRSMNWP